MRITNRFDLPDALFRAQQKQDTVYDAGQVDASVTQLIQPPRITVLRRNHINELQRDVAEGFWALLGSGIHYILQMAANENSIAEERLFMNIDGFRISGAIDLQEIDGKYVDVSDYKVTSVWSVLGKEKVKSEWVEQLNLGALLIEANKPLRVRSMRIVVIFRDWSSTYAKSRADYPQSPILTIPIGIWEKKEQLRYVRSRIEKHRKAQFDFEMGEDMDECSEEDRWLHDRMWQVFKKGGKRAYRNCDTEHEALAILLERGEDYEIRVKPGRSTRCKYCGVSAWCSQYQNSIAVTEGNGEAEEAQPEAA